MVNAQRLTREDDWRIDVDGVEEATLEERIGTGQDLLRVSNLEGHTERLKDVSGLHLLGEAINVGVDGSVVGDDPLANPLESPAHSTVRISSKILFWKYESGCR